MASIQIHEIETPMEDLSYDVSGNITGGGFFGKVLDLVKDVFKECQRVSANPLECTIKFFQDLDMSL